MTIFTRLRPLEPIFPQPKLLGSIAPGNTPADPCPVAFNSADWAYGAVNTWAAINGNHVFTISASGNSFVITDVTNPEGTGVVGALIGDANGTGSPSHIKYLSSNVVLLCSAFSGGYLSTIDVSDPREPEILDTLTLAGARRIAVDGTQVYVGATGTVYSVDASNTSSLVLDDTISNTPDLSAAGRVLEVSGDHVFAGGYVSTFSQHSLTSINISDPTDLSIADTVDFSSGFWNSQSAIITGSHLISPLTGNNPDDLVSVDISDPTAMSIAQEVSTSTIGGPEFFNGFGDPVLDGDLMYVGGQDDTPRVIIVSRYDVSDPTDITLDSEVRMECPNYPTDPCNWPSYAPTLVADHVFVSGPNGLGTIRKSCFS